MINNKLKVNQPDLRILVDNVDEDVLSRMPEWFRTLRRAYIERVEAEEQSKL